MGGGSCLEGHVARIYERVGYRVGTPRSVVRIACGIFGNENVRSIPSYRTFHAVSGTTWKLYVADFGPGAAVVKGCADAIAEWYLATIGCEPEVTKAALSAAICVPDFAVRLYCGDRQLTVEELARTMHVSVDTAAARARQVSEDSGVSYVRNDERNVKVIHIVRA